jgi:hypothetical protein
MGNGTPTFSDVDPRGEVDALSTLGSGCTVIVTLAALATLTSCVTWLLISEPVSMFWHEAARAAIARVAAAARKSRSPTEGRPAARISVPKSRLSRFIFQPRL